MVERAEQLGAYVPFVHFLDLPDISFFELGHFSALILFLRRYLEVTHPRCNDLKVNAVFKNSRMRPLGFILGKVVMRSSSQVNKALLPTASVDTQGLALFSKWVQEVDKSENYQESEESSEAEETESDFD